MKNLILLFEILMSQNNPSLYQRLNTGINQDTFISKMNSIRFKFNHDVFSLYEWKNGLKDPCSLDHMFHCGVFMPLDTSLEVYKSGVTKKLWNKRFFPIFTSYQGEFLLVDMDIESTEYNKIFIYSPLMYPKPVIIYDNLPSMFSTIIKCYDSKAYIFDKSQFEIDFDQLYKIGKENNLYSIYWND
jgi:hypothetical protein